MWSLCSWVTKTASRSLAARPARARRVSSSRNEKPASTSRRVVVMPLVASTTVALPLLPLPRLQKRITPAPARPVPVPLAQVFEQEVDDALAVLGRFRLAGRVEHRDRARVALGADLDPVLGETVVVVLLAPEVDQATEEVRLLAAGEGRVDVANEIQALAAIAVLDREAAPVEGDADAAPGAIKAVIEPQGRR